jgi:hypothetical protein
VCTAVSQFVRKFGGELSLQLLQLGGSVDIMVVAGGIYLHV